MSIISVFKYKHRETLNVEHVYINIYSTRKFKHSYLRTRSMKIFRVKYAPEHWYSIFIPLALLNIFLNRNPPSHSRTENNLLLETSASVQVALSVCWQTDYRVSRTPWIFSNTPRHVVSNPRRKRVRSRAGDYPRTKATTTSTASRRISARRKKYLPFPSAVISSLSSVRCEYASAAWLVIAASWYQAKTLAGELSAWVTRSCIESRRVVAWKSSKHWSLRVTFSITFFSPRLSRPSDESSLDFSRTMMTSAWKTRGWRLRHVSRANDSLSHLSYARRNIRNVINILQCE